MFECRAVDPSSWHAAVAGQSRTFSSEIAARGRFSEVPSVSVSPNAKLPAWLSWYGKATGSAGTRRAILLPARYEPARGSRGGAQSFLGLPALRGHRWGKGHG